MVAQAIDPPGHGIERFLADLRSYHERRSMGDRRRRNEPVPVERRCGLERRTTVDRRRRASKTYAPDDAADIQSMLANPKVRAACPECDGQLMLGPTIQRGGRAIRRVHCTGCRRSADLEAADTLLTGA